MNGQLAQGTITNQQIEAGAEACEELIGRPVLNVASLIAAAFDGLIYANVHMVAAGGIISVMQFGNRQMTRDIDVIMPSKDRDLLVQLVDQIAKEQSPPGGKHAWLNDSVSFFGLQTRSVNVIFRHPHLVLYAASWHELLGMKLSGAWRRDADYDDAIHVLRKIGNENKARTLVLAAKYKCRHSIRRRVLPQSTFSRRPIVTTIPTTDRLDRHNRVDRSNIQRDSAPSEATVTARIFGKVLLDVSPCLEDRWREHRASPARQHGYVQLPPTPTG